MQSITARGLALVKAFEGFSPVIYRCPAGYPTIGYGHLVKAGEDYSQPITSAQADMLLRADLVVAERAVVRLIARPLAPEQYDALVSFTFNLGAGALQRSTLRRVVNRGEDGQVPAQLMRWIWANGRRLPGLIRRRAAEAHCYMS